MLFTSGYSENAIVHGGRLDEGVNLLPKPYTREQLARKIRAVLSNRGKSEIADIFGDSVAEPPITTLDEGPTRDGSKLRVLLVEDDPLIRMSTADILKDAGHLVLEADSANAALEILGSSPVDVLVSDIGLPDMSGSRLAVEARNLDQEIGLVFATGRNCSDEDNPDAVWLTKPYGDDDLIAAVNTALRRRRS